MLAGPKGNMAQTQFSCIICRSLGATSKCFVFLPSNYFQIIILSEFYLQVEATWRRAIPTAPRGQKAFGTAHVQKQGQVSGPAAAAAAPQLDLTRRTVLFPSPS